MITIKSWQPRTTILALFRPHVTATASPSVGEYHFSVGVVNLDPANVNCHPLGQQVGALAVLHWQYCCKTTYPMPSLLQLYWIHVCLLVLEVCIPCSTLDIISTFVSLNNLSSSAIQRNLLLGLMSYLNGCMTSLIEWAQTTSLTKPNQDRAPVMFCGTGKSMIADNMLLEGVTPDGVMLRPVKVTVFLQN